MPATLAALAKKHLYRHRRVVESPAGRELVVDGRRLLNFCSVAGGFVDYMARVFNQPSDK